MLKTLLEDFLRSRYSFVLAVCGAATVVALNEITYQHSHLRLAEGIKLTDIRIQTALALQLVTDAETGVRGYLLTGRQLDLAPYRRALSELPAAQQQAFGLIAQVDTEHRVGVEPVKRQLAAKLAVLAMIIELYDAGKRDEAISVVLSDVGMVKMAELRQAFDEVLARAASLQQTARVSLYDALLINRLAVHLLSVLSVLGLYVLMRQMEQFDKSRQHEHIRLEAQVQVRTAELRELAGHLVSAREDERGRLARELHDELGGLFTAMKLEFARVRHMPDLPKGMQDRVESIERRLNDGIAFKRRIVENLRPSTLEQMGLMTSVSLLCRDSAQTLGIPVREALEPVTVACEVELTIYRLVQESLTNVGKYACASKTSVTIDALDEGVRICVEDDGIGFDPTRVASGQHGLLGMRYRVESHGGSMRVESSPGRGTRIVVILPGELSEG